MALHQTTSIGCSSLRFQLVSTLSSTHTLIVLSASSFWSPPLMEQLNFAGTRGEHVLYCVKIYEHCRSEHVNVHGRASAHMSPSDPPLCQPISHLALPTVRELTLSDVQASWQDVLYLV